MRTISQLLPLAMSVELNPSIRCSVVLSKYVAYLIILLEVFLKWHGDRTYAKNFAPR